MEFRETRDRGRLEPFLRRNTASHLYALADLDDLFFRDTTWWAAVAGDEFRAVALLLRKLRVPILYAVSQPGDAATRALLEHLTPNLPPSFFASLGLSLEDVLANGHDFDSQGEHLKYLLEDWSGVEATDVARAQLLGPGERSELEDFFDRDAYDRTESGGRFFEPYMIERWPYAGIREHGRLVCAAGVHVYSERFRVAALGNIATRPDYRGRGLAGAATARVCLELRDRVDHIGLNVQAQNAAAIRCYEGLGFRPVCRYVEGLFTRSV